MNKSELLNALYEQLKGKLSDAGFRLVKREQAFKRKTATGSQHIVIPVWNYSPLFRFTLLASVRVDAVEDVFHRCSGEPDEIHSESSSLTTPFAYFSNEDEFSVTSVEEASDATRKIIPIIRSSILPHLNETEDVYAIDRLLNTSRNAASLVNRIRPESSLPRALIAAKLSGNPAFAELISEYSAELKDYDPDVRKVFDDVVDFLVEQ